MNYLISEDEYNRLHSVQRQLNMMANIFGGMTSYDTPCNPEDLGDFLGSQESALDAVRRAVDHRHQLSQAVDKPMRWMDWLRVIECASGEYVPLHPNAIQYIDDALSHLATLDPAYEMVVKKWVEVSGCYAKERAAKDKIKEVMQEAVPSGNMSIELFTDLMRAVSGQAMELDELNEVVRQFLAAFHEEHPERAVITQALNHALMHNGYEWVLTCGQDGQRAQWMRKAEATAPEAAPATTPAPTVGKQRKRERTVKKAKGTATTHIAEGATT